MQQLLKGKTALITGGTAGIGKAIAILFAAQGAHVAIVGTHQERACQVLAEMESARVNAEQKMNYFLLDISQTQAVNELMERLLQEWGDIHVLVNNAGITCDALLMRMSEEDWDRVIAVNLKSVYNTCHALCRSMMKARRGSIVNITSVVGLVGGIGQTNYAASKSGMIGFTKALAKELASRDIRANCIAPGYIETSMTENLSSKMKEQILMKIPLDRIGQPVDVAYAALFLASDLSSYITGQVITVDGGMVM